MTYRRFDHVMPTDLFIERLRTSIENVCCEYGVEIPVRVEVTHDHASFRMVVYIAFGNPTKLNVNWRIDRDCLSLGFIDEVTAQFEEQIPTDARFPVEVPEWLLQNHVSKR